MRRIILALALLVSPILTGCASEPAEGAASDIPAADWPSGGRLFDEHHFSPLDQINDENVSRLGLAWSLDLPGEQTLEAVPIAIDGVLYFTGQMSKVYAVDGATGKMLWEHDPETYKQRPTHQRFIFSANRGAAYWNGKVYVGTLDGRLLALDAKTGDPVWSVMTIDPDSLRTITGAPRAFDGKILIGNGGGDYGERGYLTAYDAETGKQLWRFYTVPGDPAKGFENEAMAMAAKTWNGEYWKTGTGGTVWDNVTYDRELNRVYIGTGNSGPYNPELRSPGGGDNLFLASIVAVDADTGKYIWHYQVNPREAWDFKATANIILTTLTIDGRERRVLMQSPTNGFFYVIDRESGELISAEKTGKVTWAERIDLETGRPVEAENIRYQKGPVTFWPSPYGTHNWQPMAFNPQTGLVYIPYMKTSARYELSENPSFGSGTQFTVVKTDDDDGSGKLLAWDPVAQKVRWSVHRERMWNGGIATTAGNLVFQGDANGIFHAHDARDGSSLWSFDAKLGIIAAPMTYEVQGRQYVAILVGFGGATGPQMIFPPSGWKYGAQTRRLLTFALDGKAKLPATAPRDFNPAPLDDPKLVIDRAAAARGAALYNAKACIVCHGVDGRSMGGAAPDLQESGVAFDVESLGYLLRSGALAQNGMPKFEELTDSEVRDLYFYIRSIARDTVKGTRETQAPKSGRF